MVKHPGCSQEISELARAGTWRKSPIPGGFTGSEPVSRWQIPMAGGRGSVLAPSLPPSALCYKMAWGGLSLGMQGLARREGQAAGCASKHTNHRLPAKSWATTCLSSVCNTWTQICLYSPFLFIVSALEHQASACASRTLMGGTCILAGTFRSNRN